MQWIITKYFSFVCFGVASWFNPGAMYGNQSVCAMNIVPISSHIYIVNEENGEQTYCTVIGTGPFVGGRVLDVSPSVAKKLGFLSAGTAHVRIYLEHRRKR